MTVIYTFKKIIAAVITFFMLAITGVSNPEIEDAKKEAILLNFNVLSDCHIESNNYTTYNAFTKILKNIQRDQDSDGTVFLGDNTMNGQIIEELIFFGALNNTRPNGEVMVAPGNHDMSNCEGDYNKYVKRFISHSNAFMDYKITQPYFYRVVDGYYFIVISSEDTTWEYIDISEAQYQWLEGVLGEAKESGKPIFVFSHYPPSDVKGGDERLTAMLGACENLLYFYGHTHWWLSDETAHNYKGINCINVPKTTEPTEYDCGIGAYVQVYENEIVVRMKDFHDEMYMEDYVYRYEIK